jgi:hypothetical protein
MIQPTVWRYARGVFGWTVIKKKKKAVLSVGCEKTAAKNLLWKKVEDRLVRTTISYGKLCVMGEIIVIPLGLFIYQNTRTNPICSLFCM